MTSEEFTQEVVSNNLRNKMESLLQGRYSKQYHSHIPDAVSRVIGIAFRRCNIFANGANLWSWMEASVKQEMMDILKKDKRRRKAARTVAVTSPRRYDPFKQLDWKIDLERGIKTSVNDEHMRAAMWHHFYEGYSAEDVITMLPVSERASRTWERHFFDAKTAVKREMKRKGYNL